MVLLVDDARFDDVVLTAEKPVLVDFTATWAAPCRALAEALDRFAAQNSGIEIVKIDGGGDYAGAPSDNPRAMARFDIRVFPTLLLFRGGKVAGMAIGAMDADKLATWSQDILGNPPENDIAPENFAAYSAEFYRRLEQAQRTQMVTQTRRVTLGVAAAELTGAGLLMAAGGPFGAAMAGPAAARAAWQGAQALRKKDEMPQPVKNRALSALFNLSAAATGMGLVMAPADNIVTKAACVVFATYFMAVGGLRLMGDMGRGKKDAPRP